MLSTLVVALLVLVFALVAGAAGWLVWRLWTGTSGSAADGRRRAGRGPGRGELTGVEIRSDMPTQLIPVAWLLGTWRGVGVGGYPSVPEFRFGQEITFTELPGKPFVHHLSRSWLLDDAGEQVRPLAQETGYWRPEADGSLEVVLAHPTGYAEIWIGSADGAKIELQTDVVARTETAKDYTAGHRLYGLVDGDLLWAYDMAAVGQPLQPHLSGTLKRV